ncbi:unnamed protein product [Trichobilharzia regenti]|nr:unnamed protein product [Trichobilharzia regenti]
MAIDRCLCVYMPIKYSRIPGYYAWYLFLIIVVISAVMMLPFAILVDWQLYNDLLLCWLPYDQNILHLYHTFLSGACFVQVMLSACFNIVFLIKIRRIVRRHHHLGEETSTEEKKEVSASIVLLILCLSTLIASLPQSIAYIVSFILPSVMSPESSRGPLRLAYNIADISWHFIFIQSSCNIFIYAKRIKRFRFALWSILKCQISRLHHQQQHYDTNNMSNYADSARTTTRVTTKNTGV